MEYSQMSNSELRIILNEMENEYEALKNKIDTYISRMDELDKKYVKVKTILNKRTKGKI
ncbi:MAG: hypothetical protein IKT40_02685 [Bacilli bacterium]|nr:hypothetical protein [Bacilli bacterium]